MRHASNTLTKALCGGGFIFALAAAAPLNAQDFRYGAQLSVVSPSGDLSKNASLGFGAAFLAEIPLNDKMAIRGKLDYLMFGEKTNNDYSESKLSANIYGVTADYIYRFDSHDNGLFVMAGLGSVALTLKDKYEWASLSESANGFAIHLGVGYNFTRNLGAEVKLVTSNGVKIGEERGEEASAFATNWLQASFTYRF
jgi:opacity protein-like surface antigen